MPSKVCPLTGLKLSKVAGRAAVHVPHHPAANNRGYVLRSRYVAEGKLGRALSSSEVVHHKNGDALDDQSENLEITSLSEHTKTHYSEAGLRSPNTCKIDYEQLRGLVKEGLGYKKIAKRTGWNVHTVKSACRLIRRGRR